MILRLLNVFICVVKFIIEEINIDIVLIGLMLYSLECLNLMMGGFSLSGLLMSRLVDIEFNYDSISIE